MSDSELAEMGRDMKAIRKRRREIYGSPCPKCPGNRNATILLPGQRCKVDGYKDPRPQLTREQEDALWAAQGYSRVEKQS